MKSWIKSKSFSVKIHLFSNVMCSYHRAQCCATQERLTLHWNHWKGTLSFLKLNMWIVFIWYVFNDKKEYSWVSHRIFVTDNKDAMANSAEVNICYFLQLSQCDPVQTRAVCLRPLQQSQGSTEGNTRQFCTTLTGLIFLCSFVISVIITLYSQKVLKLLKKILTMSQHLSWRHLTTNTKSGMVTVSMGRYSKVPKYFLEMTSNLSICIKYIINTYFKGQRNLYFLWISSN